MNSFGVIYLLFATFRSKSGVPTSQEVQLWRTQSDTRSILQSRSGYGLWWMRSHWGRKNAQKRQKNKCMCVMEGRTDGRTDWYGESLSCVHATKNDNGRKMTKLTRMDWVHIDKTLTLGWAHFRLWKKNCLQAIFMFQLRNWVPEMWLFLWFEIPTEIFSK